MTQARRLYEGLGYLRTPQRDWTINGVGLITYRRDLGKAWPRTADRMGRRRPG
ncbi:MAG: hypothetical protein V9G09_04790 [Candidatus Nanopelagicales bacterium]